MNMPVGYVSLASSENVSLVADERGLGEIKVLLKNGVLYNYGGWYPISDKTRNRMSYNRQGEARNLLDLAKQEQDNIRKTDGVPLPEVKKTFGDMLEESVIKSLGEGVAKQIEPVIKERLEAQLIKDFGFKPIVHKIVKNDIEYDLPGVVHNVFDMVLSFVDNNIPVMLTGPAGSGKNHLCKQVADALELEFHFVNAVTNEYRLTGFIDANGHYHKTEFFKAFTEGGLFMLDEMDASVPEVLVILNAALANGYFDFPTGRAVAHENFRAIAGANTFGTGADLQYTGRFQLDAASLDRFALIDVNYDPDIEATVAMGDMEIVKFLHDLRKATTKVGIKFVISYRAAQRMAKMKELLDDKVVMHTCVTKSLDLDDLKVIGENLKNKDNRWAKAFLALTLK